MKPLRILTRSGSLALMCFLAFSCVDESYDLDKADYNVVVLDDAISLPLGTLELRMDSILKVSGNDSTGIRVKGNMYYLSATTKMDVSGLNSSLNSFSLANPTDVSTNVNIYTAPYVPFDVPAGTVPTTTGTTTMALPNFTTNLIDVRKVTLKNTTFTMRATTSNNMGGTNLNNSIVIVCTPQDQVAEYYISGSKVTSWQMKANEDKVVEVRSLDVTTSNNLVIKYEATMTVAIAGAVRISTSPQASIAVSVKFNGIDFDAVYGKVNYSLPLKSETKPIEGLSDLLGGSNNVLSLYNPSLKVKWRENLGVPVNLHLGLSTASVSQPVSINQDFVMQAASTPTSFVVDSFVWNRLNGTSDLFKYNPTAMTVSYSMNTNASTYTNFIPKNLTLEMESTFELPIQFGSDLSLNVSTDTITNPFLSILDKLAEQPNLGFGITFDIINRIPLGIKIRLTAENKAGGDLYFIETSNIKPAKGINSQGFATDTTMTKTKLAFNTTQVDQFKNVARFRANFIISASQSNVDHVTLSPQDYIKLNIGAEITGGVNLDLNKKTVNQ